MKNFFSFSSLLVAALMLFAASLLLHPSSGISSDVLSHVCSNTTCQQRCETILKSDPGTSKADLHELSLISLRLAGEQVHSSFLKYLDLERNTTNELLKKSFYDCVGYYFESENRVSDAYRLSYNGTYNETYDKFAQVLNQAYQCAAGIPVINDSISYASGPLKPLSFLIEISKSVIDLLLS